MNNTLLSLQFGGGTLELFMDNGPCCRICFQGGELSGPLYETLAATTAIVGGAKLDKSFSFDSEPSRLMRKGGIPKEKLPVLANLLRLASASFVTLGTEGRNAAQDQQYYGHFVGVYPDRTDSDKFLIVYVTSGVRHSDEPLHNDECGCFATRISLSDPGWAEAVSDIQPLCPHVVNRTLSEQEQETVLKLNKEKYDPISKEMLDRDTLPGKCFLDEVLYKLKGMY